MMSAAAGRAGSAARTSRHAVAAYEPPDTAVSQRARDITRRASRRSSAPSANAAARMPPPEQHTPSPAGAGGGGFDGRAVLDHGRCGSPRRANASINAITTVTTTTAPRNHFVQAMVEIVIGSGRWLG